MNRQLVVATAAGLLVGLAVGRYTAKIFPPAGSLVWVQTPGAAGAPPTKVAEATPTEGSPAVPAAADGATAPAAAPAATAAAPADGQTVLAATMPSLGPADAPVVVVEISDFECPFCAKVGPTMKELLAAYPKDIRVVWANNPLPFHAKAKPAALAALAAHRQGKFWPYHDKLFANQSALEEANLRAWATELSLDMTQFDADRADPELARQVDREQRAAKALGAEGTPGFLINGRLLEGAMPADDFKRVIDEALGAVQGARSEGKQGFELFESAVLTFEPEKGRSFLEYFVLGADPPAGDGAAAGGEPPPGEGELGLPPGNEDVWKLPLGKDDAILGNSAEAVVTIVEVSDFECPFCSQASQTLKSIKTAHGDKVRLAFKHFPLSEIHPNARAAHAASIAAQAQGKFWEYHDKLFEGQDALNEGNYVQWAKELGLNIQRFNKVRKSPATMARIDADLAQGQSIRVDGTPHTVINGRKLAGALPEELINKVIEQEIAKAERSGRKGAGWYNEIISKGKAYRSLEDQTYPMNVSALPFMGKKNAPITLVAFSDFECPYCQKIAGPLSELVEGFGGKLRIVFAHYPLPFHENARPAHVMAQEAWEQGGQKMFWPVHDALFAAQDRLSQQVVDEIAKANGLDMAKLKAAQADKRHERRIDSTMKMGQNAQVEGTPNLYLNGRRFIPMAGSLQDAVNSVLPRLGL